MSSACFCARVCLRITPCRRYALCIWTDTCLVVYSGGVQLQNPPSDVLKREGLAQSSVQRLVSNAAGFPFFFFFFFLCSSSSPPPCGSARLHLMETLPPWEAWQVVAPHRNVQSALFVRGTLGIWSRKTSGSFRRNAHQQADG